MCRRGDVHTWGLAVLLAPPAQTHNDDDDVLDDEFEIDASEPELDSQMSHNRNDRVPPVGWFADVDTNPSPGEFTPTRLLR